MGRTPEHRCAPSACVSARAGGSGEGNAVHREPAEQAGCPGRSGPGPAADRRRAGRWRDRYRPGSAPDPPPRPSPCGSVWESCSAGSAWVTLSSVWAASGTAGAALAAPAPVAAKAAPRAATPRDLAADCFMKTRPRNGMTGCVSGAATVITRHHPPQTSKCGRLVNTVRIPCVPIPARSALRIHRAAGGGGLPEQPFGFQLGVSGLDHVIDHGQSFIERNER